MSDRQSECVATPFINVNEPYKEFNTYGVEKMSPHSRDFSHELGDRKS